MSEEALKSILIDFGLTETESEVYLFLSRRCALKGTEIAKNLAKDKAQVYHILRDLQMKGLVESTLEAPIRFIAVSFETVVESAIKLKKDEAFKIENAKKNLVEYWKSTSRSEANLPAEKFVVLEGRQRIYSKIAQMIAATQNQLLTISAVPSLLRADQFELYEAAAKNPNKKRILFRLITKLSEQNIASFKTLLNKMLNNSLNYSIRTCDLTANLSPRMVIRDDKEALFFITPPSVEPTEEYDESCLWTNCADLVQAFTSVFAGTWHNSTDAQAKIQEIMVGKPSSKIATIADAKSASKKYHKVLNSAKKEVILVTSQSGLVSLKNDGILKNWFEKGVNARILAPITSETQEIAKCFNKGVEVRHIPSDYLETSIIDKVHFFQFQKNLREGNSDSINTFYTSNSENTQKTKEMLDYIWLAAQAPSATTLSSVSQNQSEFEDPFFKQTVPKTIQKMHRAKVVAHEKPGNLSNEQVVERLIWTPTSLNSPEVVAKTYGTNCQAIVNLPSHLNVPNMLFHVYHIEKHSTFGREDTLLLHPWLKTRKGYAYVFSALFTDNPKALDFWKKVCANSPAEQNIHLVDEDAIEVRVHGNTLFAGWTVPLKLNQSCAIPPSCILVEGYNETKSAAYTVMIPSGYKLKTECNYNEAFVTFLHPLSNYFGPGTDGVIARDVIMEFIKP